MKDFFDSPRVKAGIVIFIIAVILLLQNFNDELANEITPLPGQTLNFNEPKSNTFIGHKLRNFGMKLFSITDSVPKDDRTPEEIQYDIDVKNPQKSAYHEVRLKEAAKLKITLPKDLVYQQLDIGLGDDMLTVYGEDRANGIHLYSFSKKGALPNKEIMSYLNDYKKGLPGLENQNFADMIQKKPRESDRPGIENLEVSHTKNHDFFMVKMNRSDGQGTYLFMLKAKPEMIDNVLDDQLSSLYKEMEALESQEKLDSGK